MEIEREDSEGSDDNLEEDGGGGSESGGDGGAAAAPSIDDSGGERSADSEEEMYDIGLAAAHSYMSVGMKSMSGRSVLEAGWRGRVPATAHHSCVFPGETVPMLLPHAGDAALLAQAIKHNRVFGLLCPDETGTVLSGYGVLCEVYEAGMDEDEETPSSIMFKARANHRFRLTQMPKHSVSIDAFSRMHFVEVLVLPELATCDTLRAAQGARGGPRAGRGGPDADRGGPRARVRRMEAAATPWPLFVHDIFDYQRMRRTLQDYFKSIMLDKLPEDPVSLSFWVASNMALSPRDRLALLVADHALLRLRLACGWLRRAGELACACGAAVARRAQLRPMSSEGVLAHYVNLGGHVHDLLTVSHATNVRLTGAPTAEYSWFPGYTWTIAVCANCTAHLGWRFVAEKRSLRPQQFYGLCRNHLRPRDSPPREET